MTGRDAAPQAEGLRERTNRAKARWLKRVMYDPRPTSTQKCFAFLVADHLNCVTLDAWPAQATICQLLGCRSIKTSQRIARGLVQLEFLSIRHSRKNRTRYAPVFHVNDTGNTNVQDSGHLSAELGDTNVQESLLGIHIQSCSTEAAGEQGRAGPKARPSYNRRQRGAVEMRLAEMLGKNGIEILTKLSSFDDAIIDRLCNAYAEGALGEREFMAARLAAEQL